MIDDLRHLPPREDAFQIITPDMAIFVLCVLIALAAIFYPYIN